MLLEHPIALPAQDESVKVEPASSPIATPAHELRSISPLGTFAAIWASAALLHLLAFPFWARTWQGWLLVLSVGFVLNRPQSLPRFTFFIVAALLNLFRQMPFVPNHFLFEGMIHVTVLLSIAWVTFDRKKLANYVGGLLPAIKSHRFEVASFAIYLPVIIAFQNEYVGGITTSVLAAVLTYRWTQAHRATARSLADAPGGPAGENRISGHLPSDSDHLTTNVDRESKQEDSVGTRVFAHFAPIARLQLVLMYFWAVIQKLNWDYLDTSVSAAATLHREIADIFPFVPAGEFSLHLAIYGSLAFESGIPLLLLFPRTRTLGFVCALFFHAVLSLHPHAGIFSFSTLIYAMLVLFMPTTARDAMVFAWARFRQSLSRLMGLVFTREMAATVVYTAFYGFVIFFALLYRQHGEERSTFEYACSIAAYGWATWGAFMAWSYLTALWESRGTDRRLPNRLVWSPALLGVALVVFNGLMPWIGLKTQTTFSMFSNLRTEFEENHLFLSRVDLFPLQNSMVEVVASTPELFDPKKVPHGIELYANTGPIINTFEIRRLLSRIEGDIEVTFERDGQRTTIWRRGDEVSDPTWFEPYDLATFKLLWFRRHERWDGPMHTTH